MGCALLDIPPFNLRRRSVYEPFCQIPVRVWNVVVAAPEECTATVAADRGMFRGFLEVQFTRDDVGEEIEQYLGSEQHL
jgi:hypothetical protein